MWNIFGDGPLEWSEDADAVLYARIDGPLAWQQHALCAQTDPEAFSPRRAAPLAKPRQFVRPARFAKIASSMPSLTMSVSAFGVACRNARGGACAVWPVESRFACRRRDLCHQGGRAAHSVRSAGHRESNDGPAFAYHHRRCRPSCHTVSRRPRTPWGRTRARRTRT